MKDLTTMGQAVGELLKERKHTIAVAESSGNPWSVSQTSIRYSGSGDRLADERDLRLSRQASRETNSTALT